MSSLLTALQDALTDKPVSGIVVGLSGGLDSTVLLHVARQCCALHNTPLRAIHINHGIQNEARDWQAQCQQLCEQWQISLQTAQCELAADASEEQARDARYAIFADSLQQGEVLLLAQHLDDQLETMLLRLMRGAGPSGLAGMPHSRVLGAGQLLRPWLAIGRAAIAEYAAAHGLQWSEDPSNAESRYDRNFCRLEILPRLETRWPNYRESWQKSQALLAESSALLADLARLDLAKVQSGSTAQLSVEALLKLDPGRQRNLLRYWLQRMPGVQPPGWQLLHQISGELINAGSDSEARLEMGDIYLQVHQQQLYALRQDHFAPPAAQHWNIVQQPRLGLPGNGALMAESVAGEGLGRVHADNLELRYRQGGESLRLPGRPTKSLKKLFQELAVPPWFRQRTPLLFQEERLVYVPGIGVHADCKATPDEKGFVIHWQHPQLTVSLRSATDASQS